MSDIIGNWPVTGAIQLIAQPIVTGDFFNVADAGPGLATVTFFDTLDSSPISLDVGVAPDGLSLSGDATVGAYRYFVSAMVETVGGPSVLYRTISGTVLRKGGGTEDSGGQWAGGPLRPK